MNPNYPQSDDFQGRPRYYDEDERPFNAGQGRFWGEGPQRGRGEEQYQQQSRQRGQGGREQQGREQWGGSEQPGGGHEQPWGGREQQWGEPSRGEQWGRGEQQHGERARYPQDYQQGGRQRYQPDADEQYGQPYGQSYGQQYGQPYDQERQPYGHRYEESYIGAYPSNASEAYRGEGGWRQPRRASPQRERWRQGSWDEPYQQRPDQYGQPGEQYGQQPSQQYSQYGQPYGYGPGARSQQQDYQGFRGRGPKGYSRSDERIKEDICERLSQDPRIDASEISVECRGGMVMLEGTVEDRATKHRVEDLVDACSGVKDIQNHLGISSGQRETEQQAGSTKTAAAAGSTKKQ